MYRAKVRSYLRLYCVGGSSELLPQRLAHEEEADAGAPWPNHVHLMSTGLQTSSGKSENVE